MEYAIEMNHLTKYYGKHCGVEDLSLSVKKGDIFGFLGPNGAGKSTSIRCLLGLIHYEQGSAKILGEQVGENPKRILQKVGYMPSEVMFYPSLKASDVIEFTAKMHKKDCTKKAKILCERLEVPLNKKIEELSLGNRKKVGIVCAMQHDPGILIFDEPTSGLDPLMQEEFFHLVLESHNAGATCFLSSHVLSEVKKYCKNAGIIRDGKLIRQDTVENLTKSNLRFLHITGLKEELNFQKLTLMSKQGAVSKYQYSGDMKELLAFLSRYSFQDLLITEPSLEEVFMHYYEA